MYLSSVVSYMFRCLSDHLQGVYCDTCSKTVSFFSVVTQVVLWNIKNALFLIYNAITTYKTIYIYISSVCILQILKMSVKILSCCTLMPVGSRFLLCKLEVCVHCVFIVCSLCVHCGLTVCSLCAHCVFPVCSLCVHCVFTVCSLCVHCVFTVCSLCVHCVLTVCSLCAHCVFTVCSLFAALFGSVLVWRS